MPRDDFADTYPMHGGEDIGLTQLDEDFAEAVVCETPQSETVLGKLLVACIARSGTVTSQTKTCGLSGVRG